MTIVIDSDDGLEARFTLERERGGVVEEPPFRMLVLGDWSGDSPKKDIAERRPIEVDRDNFDELIRRLAQNSTSNNPTAKRLASSFANSTIFTRIVYLNAADVRSASRSEKPTALDR